MRTSRCTPLSAFRKPKANGPSNWIVALLMPAPSPSWRSSSVRFQPCFSPYMRYIRSSISAQSWLSVPPAPELICITAGNSSSGWFNVLLNSASSIWARALECASRVSSSLASPAFQKSNNTAKSSTAVSTDSKSFTQYSFSLIFLRISVARLLSSQKPGLSDNCFSSLILYCRLSTSKKPPQDDHTVLHTFDLFLCHSLYIDYQYVRKIFD